MISRIPKPASGFVVGQPVIPRLFSADHCVSAVAVVDGLDGSVVAGLVTALDILDHASTAIPRGRSSKYASSSVIDTLSKCSRIVRRRRADREARAQYLECAELLFA